MDAMQNLGEKLASCPFCGRKMVFYKNTCTNKLGKKYIEQFFMHKKYDIFKEENCILDIIQQPFIIPAGDARPEEGYIGELAEKWNNQKSAELFQNLKSRKMQITDIENYMQFEDECVQKGFSFKSLLEAREKQIALKPLEFKTPDNVPYYGCPCCGHTDVEDQNYCDNCGQKLNQSE